MGSKTDARAYYQKRLKMGIFERPEGVWWISYHDELGKHRRQKVGPKSRALTLYNKRKEEVRLARLFPEMGKSDQLKISVAEMIERLWPAFEVKATVEDDRRYARVWVKELGTKLARDVTPSDIERFRASRLRAGLRPATVNRHVAFLKRVYNLARQDDLELPNPPARLKALKENNERVRFLTPEERQALQRCALRHHWDWIQIAFETGLRQTEQVTMRRDQVDLANRILTVPKSKHGNARRVNLNSAAATILANQLEAHEGPWVWPGRRPQAHLHPQALIRALQRTCLLAGIENFHWHDLRHDYCSQLVMAGVDIRTVQVLAGHKTLSVTMRYAHLSPSHLQQAVERLNWSHREIAPEVAPELEPEAQSR